MRGIRGFMMGVLGWPPDTVMHEASLEDICDALFGFRRYHAGPCDSDRRPALSAMQELIRRFPDAPAMKKDIDDAHF